MKKIQTLKHIIRFIIDSYKFNSFLAKNNLTVNEKQSMHEQKICVVVQPWNGTAVPFYATTLALLLQKNNTYSVLILFDDLVFGNNELFFNIQKICINLTLRKVKNIDIQKLSDFSNKIEKIDEITIEKIASLNSIHFTRGETLVEKRQSYHKKIKPQLEQSYRALSNYFHHNSISKIIVPGGIWGSSGITAHLAKKNNITVMSYDSGEGLLLFSTDGVAAQLTDIPKAFKYIIEHKNEKKFAIQHGMEKLRQRRAGHDMYNHFSQETSENAFSSNGYLMLLNSVWDSAALGLHTVYGSMLDWILDSISFIITYTDRPIIIRQHPAEKENHINSTDNYFERIRQEFGENKRVIFIKAEESINTYDAIENSLCVLGFSSTSVVESVALGKPAIIVSNVYYANFGIAYQATSKEAYYEFLRQADNNKLIVTNDMIEKAYISNYLSQSCNWIKTEFTPNNNDYHKWLNKKTNELQEHLLIKNAVITDNPISLLIHQRNYNAITQQTN